MSGSASELPAVASLSRRVKGVASVMILAVFVVLLPFMRDVNWGSSSFAVKNEKCTVSSMASSAQGNGALVLSTLLPILYATSSRLPVVGPIRMSAKVVRVIRETSSALIWAGWAGMVIVPDSTLSQTVHVSFVSLMCVSGVLLLLLPTHATLMAMPILLFIGVQCSCMTIALLLVAPEENCLFYAIEAVALFNASLVYPVLEWLHWGNKNGPYNKRQSSQWTL
jgi:hypothetical protein